MSVKEVVTLQGIKLEVGPRMFESWHNKAQERVAESNYNHHSNSREAAIYSQIRNYYEAWKDIYRKIDRAFWTEDG